MLKPTEPLTLNPHPFAGAGLILVLAAGALPLPWALLPGVLGALCILAAALIDECTELREEPHDPA